MHLPVEKSLEVAAVCVPASQHFPYRDKGCTVQVFFFFSGGQRFKGKYSNDSDVGNTPFNYFYANIRGSRKSQYFLDPFYPET